MAHGAKHNHSSLSWRGGLLLAVALIELVYAASAQDALVLANGYHDLFDVGFVAVIVYGGVSRQWFKHWHPLRCNLGPVMIITLTVLALGLLYTEFRDHAVSQPTPNLISAVLLVASAVASFNLAREGHRQSGVLSEILTLHFAEDVLGSLVAAGIAASDLVWELQTERGWVAIGLFALTAVVAVQIVLKASGLIHLQEACSPDPDGL
ncbi:MAG TPA: hypothetical protein VK963_04505 [Candidatus Saccharimonadales bacterium]|nr:hypothetical protein [Candidatus Saccharimonadales bacterium]